MRLSAMTAVRLLLGVAGLGMGAVGVEYLLTETRAGTVRDVLVWVSGTLILHDGLLAAKRCSPSDCCWPEGGCAACGGPDC